MEVGVHVLRLLVMLMMATSIVTSQGFEDPPFLPGPPRDDVSKFEYVPERGGVIIDMEEEIVGDVVIAKINYKGSTAIRLSVTIGFEEFLGAVVRKGKPEENITDEFWYVVITKRQDYEISSMQKYTINVIIAEPDKTHQKIIFLNIQNIDDNPPIILPTTCQIRELYQGKSNCTYKVTDADGYELSIEPMTFRLDTSEADKDLFALAEDKNLPSPYEMTITIMTKQELDYDKSQMHIFTIHAYDSLPNTGNVSAIVQVTDEPNMPPRWKEIFATKTFKEKTKQTFPVVAVDGDTGINKPIKYTFSAPKNYTFISIGEDTGILQIDEINRDLLMQEVFEFELIAYKADNRSWETPFKVVLIVEDINDNVPEPSQSAFEITIPEETFVPLVFKPQILFNDIDLGEHAQYEVTTVSIFPAAAAEAFQVIPTEGYQKQEFKITIANASMLDFDIVEWQHVSFMLLAIERNDTSHTGNATITVHLENWNDELPIFLKSNYTATFNETEGKGFYVETVLAKDRDIGDKVIHSISGTPASYLSIDEATGVITVSQDDAFDFHRQRQIIVQVKAEDTLFDGPYHETSAELIINLLDVNNKNPEITMPRKTPSVRENVPNNHLITEEIVGSDIDTTAEIVFSIDWSSSYAKKQGRPAAAETYENCVKIITEYPNPEVKGNAIGKLVAAEIKPNVTIDFEEFEVLYLTIILKDNKQEIGDGITEGLLTLIIEDENDNWPVWSEGSLKTKRFVREASDSGAFIGSVLATDIDGPLYNNVTYSIKPIKSTPEDLVSIGLRSGYLEVNKNKAIDADVPKRYFLYYNITATDCNTDKPEEFCWETPGEVEIEITDTNNKDPQLLHGEFNETIRIYENATTGTDIVTLLGKDLDREDFYSQISYTINYKEHPDLRNFFSASLNGSIYVDLKDGAELDRDHGITYHDIFIFYTDNYLQEGDRNMNSNSTQVKVILLDVNDNAPELPPSGTYKWKISENAQEGEKLEPEIYAKDIDEEDTDNSRVNYVILSISNEDSPNPIPPPNDLMTIQNLDNVTGILTANKNLKGYWGTYQLWIKAFDFGHPQMQTNQTYELTVTPHNYNKPKFIFPIKDSNLRLTKERADVNEELYYTNNTKLDLLFAEDPDGLEAGEVFFEITAPEEAREYFKIENIKGNKGRLILQKNIDDDHNMFPITIKATDGGTDPGPLSEEVSFTVRFVATRGDPVFENRTNRVYFTEFDQGLEESQSLESAMDPKNVDCSEECFDIYYYIVDGETKDLFTIKDGKSNVLSLVKPLDRNATLQHVIKVAASNSASAPEAIPSQDSVLTVTIDVKDANPRPVFQQNVYTGGISLTDKIGKLMFHLKATHSEDLKINYEIMLETMVADPSLDKFKDTAFLLDKDTGELTMNFRPMDSMSGMFVFNVSATDTAGKVDTAQITVFMISEDKRISFIFENKVADVEGKTLAIAEIMSSIFEYICNIDYVLKANDKDGVSLEDQTEVRTHFIENNVAIDANIIEQKKNDVARMRKLREDLRLQELYLSDISSSASAAQDSMEEVLLILLIVVSVILGGLLVATLVVYFMKTKRLNQRLKALSTTQFGSQDSGLNRIGAAAPGTNKHALEGSNPVWNEEIKKPELDAISNTSGDSDLIGVEDNPQFAYDNLGQEKIKTPTNPRKITIYGRNEHGA